MNTSFVARPRHAAAFLFTLFLPLSLPAAVESVHGIPNFQAVNEQLYRGGQPTKDGFRELAAMGVTTVIDLRGEGGRSESEKKLVKSLGMRYVNIPMKSMRTPDGHDINHALKIMNGSDGPVFVHCRRGKDRTGAVVAAYRIQHDHWTNREALREARGYGMSWYQVPIQNYVRGYEPKEDDGAIGDQARGLTTKVADGASSILDRIRK